MRLCGAGGAIINAAQGVAIGRETWDERTHSRIQQQLIMDSGRFHKLFKTPGPAVLPVIHVLDVDQTKRNVLVALQEGAHGVFLINHNFSYERMIPIVQSMRSQFPYLWMGVNFLGVRGEEAFPILGKLAEKGTEVDAYWADNACIDERTSTEAQTDAKRIQYAREFSGWKGLYFGGVAFKGQRHVADSNASQAASIASHFMDIVTTSGKGTGIAASVKKIANMRAGNETVTIALASGVTPVNAADYMPYIDCFMVATGISLPGDFYNLDPLQLRALVKVGRGFKPHHSLPGTSTFLSWYLSLISPNTKGESFAWLDPSSMYLDAKAFSDLSDDLLVQFSSCEYDLVAGIDAMGYPLAAAMATKAGKGFLAIQRGGCLCVETDVVSYVCYSGEEKALEMRKNAFPAGTKVLIVDQWIETGETIQAAISLIKKQKGIVAGIAVICIETKPKAQELSQKYKVAHVIPHTLQPSFDNHTYTGTIKK